MSPTKPITQKQLQNYICQLCPSGLFFFSCPVNRWIFANSACLHKPVITASKQRARCVTHGSPGPKALTLRHRSYDHPRLVQRGQAKWSGSGITAKPQVGTLLGGSTNRSPLAWVRAARPPSWAGLSLQMPPCKDGAGEEHGQSDLPHKGFLYSPKPAAVHSLLNTHSEPAILFCINVFEYQSPRLDESLGFRPCFIHSSPCPLWLASRCSRNVC